MCDEDNGYYMPDDGSGAVDTAFGGACVPACYFDGTNKGGQNECWGYTIASADLDVSDDFGDEDLLLEAVVAGC